MRGLIRLLQDHPGWKTELHRLVLTEELVTVPDVLRTLIEAQRQAEESVRVLAEAPNRPIRIFDLPNSPEGM